jgi:hypothetical protein
MNRPPCFYHRVEHATRRGIERSRSLSRSKRRWHIPRRDKAELLSLPKIERAKLGVAYADGLLQHGCKHRLKIAGRAADDLEDLRGRGLLLQRFAEVGCALTQLIQKPRVFDSDDCLVGKIGYQLDLAFGEWPYFPVINGNGSDQLIFFKHWYVNHTAIATQLDAFDYKWIALDIGLYGRHVGYLRNLAGIKELAETGPRSGADHGFAFVLVGKRRWRVM